MLRYEQDVATTRVFQEREWVVPTSASACPSTTESWIGGKFFVGIYCGKIYYFTLYKLSLLSFIVIHQGSPTWRGVMYVMLFSSFLYM